MSSTLEVKDIASGGTIAAGDKLVGQRTTGATRLFTYAVDITADTAPALGGNLDLGGYNINSVTPTEIGYIAGLTSAVQTQLDSKSGTASPTFTGTVTIPTPFTLGAVSVTATGTELNYVAGVTSAIQTQLDGKAATTGNANIATVGTITSGTWNGTAITGTYIDESTVDHDSLLNFVANEHIDWTAASANFATTGTLNVGTADSMTVNGSAVTANVQINSDSQAIEEIHTHSDTAGNGGVQYFARSRGTIASPSVVQSGDKLATLAVVGFDGTDYALGARIDFEVATTPGNNDMPTKITFSVSPDGSHTPAAAVTINSTKNVDFAADIDVVGDVGGTTIGGITEANLVDKSATEVITGSWDFGGASTLEIPNGAAPSVSAAGQIAVDTTITDHTGLIKYHDGVEELTVIALPTANLLTSDGYAVAYNATNNEFEMVSVAAGTGDVVGPASATDNAIARFDLTTGKLIQDSVVTVGDTGAVAGITTLSASTSATIGGNATAAGYIELLEDSDNGSNKITITAPSSVASDKVLTLPDATDTLVGKATTDTFTNKTFDADGAGNSITNIENADIKAAAAIALDKLAATTASRALVSDASGFVTAATTTSTEIGYVNGVTSAIQTQLDGKAATTGNANIATVGTITSGTWNATDIAVADGGTGVSTMTTAYAPVCAGTTATGALQVASTGLSTSGYVLTSNGASALPSFQAPAGGGKVLQVVQTVDTTNRSTTSSSFVTSSIAASITPATTGSTILAIFSGTAGNSTAGVASNQYTLYRDAVDLTPVGVGAMAGVLSASSSDFQLVAFEYLDSPATTSSTTYTVYFKTGGGTTYLGRRGVDTTFDLSSVLTLIEIGA